MFIANDKRYDGMVYRFCGHSGLKLPAISLGMWQNFGSLRPYEDARRILLRAFDLGITHFDLANNYGPLPGTAEQTLGRVLEQDLRPYRDELIISTKAGYYMWPGPYGDHGSRKYLISSLDQSLRRMKLDYVDIFYHHRPDPDTPLEETMGALRDIVRQGKALYVGVSNYNAEQTRAAYTMLSEMGVPLLINQPCYSMLNRWCEDGLFHALAQYGIGSIAFSPLAQGVLTNRYLAGIPSDSRVAVPTGTLSEDNIDKQTLGKVRKLSRIASDRGQTMTQMALAWVLREGHATSALVGASKVEQIEENVKAVNNLTFSQNELQEIDRILNDA